MNFLIQTLARIIPVALVVWAGVYGWNYYQTATEAPNTPQAKVKKSSKNSNTKEKKEKKSATKKIRGLKTKFATFEKTDYQILLHTQGVVTAPEVTAITAQVGGKIIEINENFASGAFVKKGEVLAKLDPTDFELEIITAEATMARASAALAQEMARGEQALRNWKDIGFKEEPNELVLRKPQLREAEATVRSAEATLEQAIRNKSRCNITAPFSGVIRNRIIGNGSFISGNTQLGEILSTDFAEVRLPLSQKQLDSLEDSGQLKPQVSFSNALQQSSSKTWMGQIVRSEGEIDLASREQFLIARIDDPFSLKETHNYPMKFNQPVMASIPGKVIKDVFLVSREYVQGIRDIITVTRDQRIQRIRLEPVWEDDQQLVISTDSIPEGSVLATSRLDYAVDETSVTLLDDDGTPISTQPEKIHDANRPPTASIK